MRLFVALDLPWDLRQRVASLANGGIPGARWVPPENYHITLRFIGETPGHRAEEIDMALAGLRGRGFSLTLSGLGTFTKGGRSTALWVGVERNQQLDHLQNKIERALQQIGLEPEPAGSSPMSRSPGSTMSPRPSWCPMFRRIISSEPNPCRLSTSPCSAPSSARKRRSTPPKSNTRWRRTLTGMHCRVSAPPHA